jgi:hypothetical protein
MRGTTSNRIYRKQKRSFTLSHASVAFLERLRKERKKTSTSSVLDELIGEAQERLRRESVEDAISAYYSGLTAVERQEQEAWGKFAIDQLTGEPASR